MQASIHPAYDDINVECSCGNKFKVQSTLSKDLQLDVCAKCHPFYTGQQKIVDTAGRVDSFNKKFGVLSSKKTAANQDQAQDSQ
jgi:large subunit ribosomal protein L31